MDSPRKNRNRAACRRCQRRKIRCDGQLPRCGSCQKGNSPCINDGRQLVQRSYIASMEKRIKYLEKLVKENCPNVDLYEEINEGIVQAQEPVVDEDHEETSILPQKELAPDEGQGSGQNRQQSQNGLVPPVRSLARIESRQAHEIGLVSLSPGGEPRYIGPSSGYFFANLVLSSAGQHQKRRIPANDSMGASSAESTALAAELLHTPASLPPRQETAIELSSKYFETIHITHPFLHQPSHLAYINQMYSAENCLASLIDLGLQRDVRNTPSLKISLLEQEMRTRVFWVVYTFDRTIGTMMGRPVGIRDEACDLRLPMDISDDNLVRQDVQERTSEQPPSHISFGIHLFKAARLNSEIKYIMHSVSREPPAYAYPPIRDIFIWQREMLERLQAWKSETPHAGSVNNMSATICEIKYHEMMILILRPSPAIPEPQEESSTLCFRHAMELLQSFRELYKHDALQYSRLVVHSIFLATLVVLHSIWKLPDISANIQIDDLSKNITAALNILSSIGEYWLEAQRARDCIDEISGVTMRRLLKTRGIAEPSATPRQCPRTRAMNVAQQRPNASCQVPLEEGITDQQQDLIDFGTNPVGFGDFHTGLPEGSLEHSDTLQLFGNPASEESFGLTGVPDFDSLMWELFSLS
ncbi:hypothetical protein BBP40_010762 [Aspergillus hancockii]|nr:hypothetical protein BBP40_010762 [Aspergillus hancockii]